MSVKYQIDDIDRKILSHLVKNARIPFLEIARECGIDKQLSFHLARHTYATTICLSNGVSLETLSKMLGHKNITTTQIYAKVTHPMIDREVSMLKEKLQDKFAI